MPSNTDMCTPMKPAANASANVPGAKSQRPVTAASPGRLAIRLAKYTPRNMSDTMLPRSQANRGTSGFRLSQVATGCQQAACDQDRRVNHEVARQRRLL